MNTEIALVERESSLPVQTAINLIIQSNQDLEEAKSILDTIRALQKKIHEVFDPMVEAAFKSHKTATLERKNHLIPLERAESELKKKIDKYLTTLENERQAAEAERKRIEEEEYQKRKQAELEAAKTAKPFGQFGPPDGKSYTVPEINKFRAQPLTQANLPMVAEAPRVQGLTQVKDWKWKIVDLAAIPPDFWILDEKAIESRVKADKENTNIPGIEVYYEMKSRISN